MKHLTLFGAFFRALTLLRHFAHDFGHFSGEESLDPEIPIPKLALSPVRIRDTTAIRALSATEVANLKTRRKHI